MRLHGGKQAAAGGARPLPRVLPDPRSRLKWMAWYLGESLLSACELGVLAQATANSSCAGHRRGRLVQLPAFNSLALLWRAGARYELGSDFDSQRCAP